MGGTPLCIGDSKGLTSVLLGRVITPDLGVCSVGSRMLAKIGSKGTESLCLLREGVIVYMSRNQTWREGSPREPAAGGHGQTEPREGCSHPLPLAVMAER